MKWLLLMIVASADGEIAVNVLSDHETMAGCHGRHPNPMGRAPSKPGASLFPDRHRY